MKPLIKLFHFTWLMIVAITVTHQASANTNVWNATNGISLNTNWSTTANWIGGIAPTSADDARFLENGAEAVPGTINNVVDAGFGGAIASLRYNQTNGSHTTLIMPGVTLILTGTNGLTAGSETIGVYTNSQQETNIIIGPGAALVINNTNANLTVRQCGSSAPTGPLRSTFDMSGLDTFNATLGNVRVGQQISTTIIRATGTLSLAKTNTLNLGGVFIVGDTANNAGGQNIVNLGQTNAIFANTFNIGYSKGLGLVRFNPALSSPTLYLRGKTATRVPAMNIGDASVVGISTAPTTGILDFSAGSVDAQVGTIFLGRGQPSAGTTGPGTGTLSINAGTFDSDITELGYQQNSTGTSIATGTLNVSGTATYIINTSLRLARFGGAGGIPVGTLNITNGTVLAKGSISAGGGTSTINMVGGSLIATNGGVAIGALGAAITTFNISDSTLGLAVSPSTPSVVASTVNNSGTLNTINIASVPSISGYPATFPIIKYDSLTGDPANLGLGSLPAGSPTYGGYLSNDTSTASILLVITNGPTPSKSVTWYGNVNGLWDTSTTNWKTNPASAALAYNQGDFVTFDDSVTGTTGVNLTTALLPGTITVNNSSSNYTFSGTGKLSGTSSLSKQGTGTLILANAGANDYSGGTAISNGAVQIGTNGTSGNLPAAGAVANDGSLIFNRSDDLTVPNVVTGSGSLTKTGNGTLTLSGNNTYSGGLTVNAGTARLSSLAGAGSGSIGVNNAMLVAGAAHGNPVTLANGILGAVSGLASIPGEVTAASSTTNSIYISDPQNQAVNSEMNFTSTLHGSGNLVILSGTNNINPDGGVGFRLRSTSVSDFSGTITIGHNVKGELQTSAIGPFSPAGTGKMILTCGDALFGGTNAAATTTGGYAELNLRNNNSSGDTTFGNDIELTGSGLAILNPLGSAAAGALINVGNLKIGAGQELGVFLNTGNAHTIAFSTVTLTGGTARFSPKISGFGPPASVGSDLSLGDISQSVGGAGITMAGLRTLIITGTGTYTGPTVVSNGTLRLDGTLGSTATTVSGGTLSGIGTTAGSVTVGNGGTLSPGNGVGTFNINNNLSLAGNVLIEVDTTLSPSNDIVNVSGSLVYGGTITATNIGANPLASGDAFQIFPAGGTGTISVLGSPGTGLAWSFDKTTGVLSVVTAAPPTPTTLNFGVTNGVTTFGWTGAFKLSWQTNSRAIGLSTNWVDYPDPSNPINVTNNPAIPNVYFRLQSL